MTVPEERWNLENAVRWCEQNTGRKPCLATIMLSLWDEDILRAEALIKLALMGFTLG